MINIKPTVSKYGSTCIMYFSDHIELINPDMSRKLININNIDKLNDIVTEFRKEHNIKSI